MTSAISASDATSSDALPPLPVRRITVEQYFELARLDFFGEDDRVELLQGYIVPKMVKKPAHENVLYLLFQLLLPMMGNGWFLRMQGVVQTADSAPEPDLSITRGSAGDYPNRHPTGADVAIVVEVADSSIKRDRLKAEIYGNAGIPVYWLVNMRSRCVEVYDRPQPDAHGNLNYDPPRIIDSDGAIDVDVNGSMLGRLVIAQFLPESAADDSLTDPT